MYDRMCHFGRWRALSWRPRRKTQQTQGKLLVYIIYMTGGLTRKSWCHWMLFFFFLIRKSPLQGLANICSPNICSSHLPVNGSPPFEALGPTPSLSSTWPCRTALESQILWGSHTFQISFSPVNLFFVSLMMRPAKEPKGKKGKLFYAFPGVTRSMHNPFGRL